MSNARILFHRLLRSKSRTHGNVFERLERMNVKLDGRLSRPLKFMSDNLKVLAELLTKQCNVIAAQRVQRTSQILNLYQKLYGDKLRILSKLGELLRRRGQNRLTCFLLSAAPLFAWRDENIKSEEIDRCVDELKVFFDLQDQTRYTSEKQQVWEKVIDQPDFKLWRCPVADSHLYQYRAFGSYKDITARSFYNVQVDLDYRKQWDSHVVKLDKVDFDSETGSEVIHWVTKYPLGFMYEREYVYVRRYMVDPSRRLMIMSARAVQHPKCPAGPNYVQVTTYKAQMIIRPHKSFDENGFDYVMSYYDEPQLYVPTRVINWMTFQSLPSFLTQLHEAAKKLHDGGSPRADNSNIDSSKHAHSSQGGSIQLQSS